MQMQEHRIIAHMLEDQTKKDQRFCYMVISLTLQVFSMTYRLQA